MTHTRSRGSLFCFAILFLATTIGVFRIISTTIPPLDVIHPPRPYSPPSSRIPSWIRGKQVQVPADLELCAHCAKHKSEELDADLIYANLLQGRCAASTKFCKGTRRLYLCLDQATGLLGGMFVDGTTVVTGYGASVRYWEKKWRWGGWGGCQ